MTLRLLLVCAALILIAKSTAREYQRPDLFVAGEPFTEGFNCTCMGYECFEYLNCQKD